MEIFQPLSQEVMRHFRSLSFERESNIELTLYDATLLEPLGPFPKGVVFNDVLIRLDEDALDVIGYNPKLNGQHYLAEDIVEYDELRDVPFYNLAALMNITIRVNFS